MKRALYSALALALWCLSPAMAQTAKNDDSPALGASVGQRSGLPLPRFASLKAGEANLRRGPGKEHPVIWVYVRKGLPVEIIEEYDTWRRVRDIDGAEGWIAAQMLSESRRTSMVRTVPVGSGSASWALRRKPSPTSDAIARLEPGVVAVLRRCPDAWCEVKAGGVSGWIERAALWGLYPGEILN